MNDLDRRVWRDELDSFVPHSIIDAHSHIWRASDYLGPADEQPGSWFTQAGYVADLAGLRRWHGELLPGRELSYLAFPFPFRACDFAGANAHIAAEIAADAKSAALMLVHPGTTRAEAEAGLEAGKFLGFKPYRVYAPDMVEARITDFLPEHLITLANERGLIVMLHLAKQRGVGDPQNLEDLESLTGRFPRVRWILAHCARAFAHWTLEPVADRVRQIPNIWFDTSAVNSPASMTVLLQSQDPARVMYGSDDLPVGISRGKYVDFGYVWTEFNDRNVTADVTVAHGDAGFTYVLYEELRALKFAAGQARFKEEQIRALFHDNARALIDGVRVGS